MFTAHNTLLFVLKLYVTLKGKRNTTQYNYSYKYNQKGYDGGTPGIIE